MRGEKVCNFGNFLANFFVFWGRKSCHPYGVKTASPLRGENRKIEHLSNLIPAVAQPVKIRRNKLKQSIYLLLSHCTQQTSRSDATRM